MLDLRQIQNRLRRHAEYLSGEIGERHPTRYDNLENARAYIERTFQEAGYTVGRDEYEVEGKPFRNVIAENPGRHRPQEIHLLGAHYDTVPGSPGADDNASGIACLLELARLIRKHRPPVTVRMVAFTLEEPPYFGTPFMGSMVHARKCRQRKEKIMGMLSLEMVGYYRDQPNSQRYPLPLMNWFYPDRGDFIAVVGNFRSRHLAKNVANRLKQRLGLAVVSTALPFVPGAGLSDNRSFWQHGYPALMITDTAFFRNPHYHLPTDLPETLDYQRMAELVAGVAEFIVPAEAERA